MIKKKGQPNIGEFVICKITSVNPNSCQAVLEEYETEGMIHISEVKSGWIKDIRKHVKVGQLSVAKVLRSGSSYVTLSLKRVDDNQKRNKLKDYNMNIKAEKMFELCAKELDVSVEKAHKEIGDKLLENYSSFYDVFKVAMKNPAKLEVLIPKRWVEKIKEMAEKTIVQKEFEFRAKITIKSMDSDGITIIKNVLKKAAKTGVDIKYISAPEYMAKFRTKDAKKGEKEFQEKLDKAFKGEKGLQIEYKLVQNS